VALIRGVLADLVTTIRSLPGLVGILADARSNPDFPPAALELVAAWRARLLARLAGAVRDGQRRGYFRDDVDPERLLADHCAWR
jgi:hypothetical protein